MSDHDGDTNVGEGMIPVRPELVCRVVLALSLGCLAFFLWLLH
jgi:hypothetical protein